MKQVLVATSVNADRSETSRSVRCSSLRAPQIDISTPQSLRKGASLSVWLLWVTAGIVESAEHRNRVRCVVCDFCGEDRVASCVHFALTPLVHRDTHPPSSRLASIVRVTGRWCKWLWAIYTNQTSVYLKYGQERRQFGEKRMVSSLHRCNLGRQSHHYNGHVRSVLQCYEHETAICI